jgi:hypothetical protein
MSLTDSSAAAAAALRPVTVILRTADQYHLWKARISTACWSATRANVFEVSDNDCDKGLKVFAAGETKSDWVGRCWSIVTNALHDELFMKLAHVQQGHLATLMSEIRAALLVNIAEDIQPLRLELYAANMQSCSNDLQTYISFIMVRRDKLLFLGVTVPEEEVVHVFLKGLHSVFQPLQVHFAVPGTTPTQFDKAIDIVRKYAASPTVYAELSKLKSVSLRTYLLLSLKTNLIVRNLR